MKILRLETTRVVSLKIKTISDSKQVNIPIDRSEYVPSPTECSRFDLQSRVEIFTQRFRLENSLRNSQKQLEFE